jgi:RNA recognition motif-containing protein
MTKLYVGNLPFSANEETVRALFAEFGAIQTLSLVNDRETGRPRGFGFVEMSSDDAAKAMQSLNGRDFGGRPLKVNEAQDRPRGGQLRQPPLIDRLAAGELPRRPRRHTDADAGLVRAFLRRRVIARGPTTTSWPVASMACGR